MFLIPVIAVVVTLLIIRCWRVTIPLLTVAGIYGLVHWAPALGWSLIGFIGVITGFVLWSQAKDRRIGALHADR